MEEYLGFKEVVITDDNLTWFFKGDWKNENKWDLLTNEYVTFKDEHGTELGIFRFDGAKNILVPFKAINTRYFSKVKPKNVQQQMAVDMLYNNDITIKMLSGVFGSGKDFLMCNAAIDMLERGKIDKIVYVRNNIEVKDSKPIGYLPGTNNDKLMPYAMVLADKLGGMDSLEMMINQGKVEIAHLGFMRGRDVRNSIIYCSEAENMTKQHLQLLISRVGEGSSLWINGDHRQTDMEVFKENSGMKIAVEKLKGHPRFGYVQLIKTERSETAAMADLLD